jgi:hypothetical protein
MEHHDIRELIVYKKNKGIPLTQEEKQTALQYMSEEQIERLYRSKVSVAGCFSSATVKTLKVAATRPLP